MGRTPEEAGAGAGTAAAAVSPLPSDLGRRRRLLLPNKQQPLPLPWRPSPTLRRCHGDGAPPLPPRLTPPPASPASSGGERREGEGDDVAGPFPRKPRTDVNKFVCFQRSAVSRATSGGRPGPSNSVAIGWEGRGAEPARRRPRPSSLPAAAAGVGRARRGVPGRGGVLRGAERPAEGATYLGARQAPRTLAGPRLRGRAGPGAGRRGWGCQRPGQCGGLRQCPKAPAACTGGPEGFQAALLLGRREAVGPERVSLPVPSGLFQPLGPKPTAPTSVSSPGAGLLAAGCPQPPGRGRVCLGKAGGNPCLQESWAGGGEWLSRLADWGFVLEHREPFSAPVPAHTRAGCSWCPGRVAWSRGISCRRSASFTAR